MVQGQREEAVQWIGYAADRGDELAAAWMADHRNE
jgi:hypothetical protein